MSTPETTTPFTDALIAQLNAELGASKYSMRSLALEMGEPYGTIRRYLKGEREMPVWVLGQILATLEIDPTTFMARAQERLKA